MSNRFVRKGAWLAVGCCVWLSASPDVFAAEKAENGAGRHTMMRIYLSGKGPADAVQWDFICSAGRNSGSWTTIPVPSNWEQHGFGGYNYGHDHPDKKHAETGTYRTTFHVPEAWSSRHVRLVFEGSMTETSIKVNGKPVGAPNVGGYLPFRYVLTKSCLKYGEENVLEVEVKKKPDNHSLDIAERKADYWVFGGIYRPVYLEVLPKGFVDHVAINARADGAFHMEVYPIVDHNMRRSGQPPVFIDEVVAQIQTLEGSPVGAPMNAAVYGGCGRIALNSTVGNITPWSPEVPTLYQVRVELKKEGQTVSEMTQRFGFRTFELRPQEGLYLNGKKIIIKGVNRNVFRPDTARAIDAEQAWEDARAIKSMNVNLVRSHMPPTSAFMEACDELGLLVIAELCNWQAPHIDTPICRNIVYELVRMYQNYPSVILWANGNVGGFNLEVDALYHLYDVQSRPVIHPWSFHEGLDTFHYPNFDALRNKLKGDQLYLPTEFLHGLYDGGHGAGLDDYWKLMSSSPMGAGGVLWCWADAAIKRTDQNGRLDTYGNKSADGIVGPYGEKEGSFYTIREIWSPVQIPLEALPHDFDGKLPVDNGFYDTSLDQCRFSWRLVRYDLPAETSVVAEGMMTGPSVAPGQSGTLTLPLPKGWEKCGALELVALSPENMEFMRWAWPIHPVLERGDERVLLKQNRQNPFEIQLGQSTWLFSPENGRLLSCSVNGEEIGLANGPTLMAATKEGPLQISRAWKTSITQKGNSVIIDAQDRTNESSCSWTLSRDGTVTLAYSFAPLNRDLVYSAVVFDLPEEQVSAKKWLGDGPFRVWANRLKGPRFGLWDNEYNDAITGVNWITPEFKGIFNQVDWMQIDLKSGAAITLDTLPGSAVGVLRPKNAKGKLRDSGTGPVRAYWAYPEKGGLYLFHQLPAVGTKFHDSWNLGYQSRPVKCTEPIAGQVIFHVGESSL